MKTSILILITFIINGCNSVKTLERDEFPRDNYTLVVKDKSIINGKAHLTITLNNYATIYQISNDTLVNVGDTLSIDSVIWK